MIAGNKISSKLLVERNIPIQLYQIFVSLSSQSLTTGSEFRVYKWTAQGSGCVEEMRVTHDIGQTQTMMAHVFLTELIILLNFGSCFSHKRKV